MPRYFLFLLPLASTRLKLCMMPWQSLPWPCSTELKNFCVQPNWEMTMFHQIEKWPCSIKLRNDHVPKYQETCRNDHVPQNWKMILFHQIENDQVPWNWEMTMFQQIDKDQTPQLLSSILNTTNLEMTMFHQIRKNVKMSMFHRIEKRLCSTDLEMTMFQKKMRNDCVPPNWQRSKAQLLSSILNTTNWEMTVFHQI